MAKKKTDATAQETPKIDLESAKVEVQTTPEIPAEKIVASELENPAITSPHWHNFVMLQFDEAELDNSGYPRVSGLRRVTELLLGEIVYSSPDIVSDDANRSCVVHTVKIQYEKEHNPRVFAEVADATKQNVGDDAIALHLPAVASTRAEARALRKALKLRVLSSEEASAKKDENGKVPEVSNDTGFIDPGQIQVLEIICSRNNVNLWKYVNSGESKYTSVEKIPYAKAQKMLRHLGLVQAGKAQLEPDKLGYDSNWRHNIVGV